MKIVQKKVDLDTYSRKIFMDLYSPNNDTSTKFFQPLNDLYPLSDKQYRCSELSDIDYVKMGTLRVLSHAKSGHQFLQYHADQGGRDLSVDHFFKALKSKRRLSNLMSLNHLMLPLMKGLRKDPFEEFETLKKWHFYAADGHYQQAAIFDAKAKSTVKGVQTKIPTAHFFRMDLRTQHMGYIDLANCRSGKKREHDMTMIKRCESNELRNHAPKGEKVLYVWDKACIDYAHWEKLKRSAGVYFCTLEKATSVVDLIRDHLYLDTDDPVNEGIEKDQLVGTSKGYELRRIVYTNPEDGTTYTYLTNEFTLPPSILVMLYKHRWDIEKVFHQFKSKLEERRSWASSPTAKKAHAIFECVAHNLMLLFEDFLIDTEGLSDEVEKKKQAGRIKNIQQSQSFINTHLRRATQRTQRFIRWLRSFLYSPAQWSKARSRLAIVWGCCSS